MTPSQPLIGCKQCGLIWRNDDPPMELAYMVFPCGHAVQSVDGALRPAPALCRGHVRAFKTGRAVVRGDFEAQPPTKHPS